LGPVRYGLRDPLGIPGGIPADFVRGLRMVPMWDSPLGNRLGPGWYPCGNHLVSIWVPYGTANGTRLGYPAVSRRVLAAGSVWSPCGIARSVLIWVPERPFWVPLWDPYSPANGTRLGWPAVCRRILWDIPTGTHSGPGRFQSGYHSVSTGANYGYPEVVKPKYSRRGKLSIPNCQNNNEKHISDKGWTQKERLKPSAV